MPHDNKSYKSKTYKSRDPLRAVSHNARLRYALDLCKIPNSGFVLDFGGGDGAFLSLLEENNPEEFEAVLFEPYMEPSKSTDLRIEKEWRSVEKLVEDNRLFDLVSCQEVMEHFAPHRQDEALQRIAAVLAPEGQLLLSVPVEVGPIAVVKNIGRWKYRKNSTEIYNYRNLARSFLGLPIPEARSGDKYLTHMGFYFRDFEKILKRYFHIEHVGGSPFPKLPLLLNSQIFYLCKPVTAS